MADERPSAPTRTNFMEKILGKPLSPEECKGQECHICQEGVGKEPMKHQLVRLSCGHPVHSECITEWVRQQKLEFFPKLKCAMCRRSIYYEDIPTLKELDVGYFVLIARENWKNQNGGRDPATVGDEMEVYRMTVEFVVDRILRHGSEDYPLKSPQRFPVLIELQVITTFMGMPEEMMNLCTWAELSKLRRDRYEEKKGSLSEAELQAIKNASVNWEVTRVTYWKYLIRMDHKVVKKYRVCHQYSDGKKEYYDEFVEKTEKMLNESRYEPSDPSPHNYLAIELFPFDKTDQVVLKEKGFGEMVSADENLKRGTVVINDVWGIKHEVIPKLGRENTPTSPVQTTKKAVTELLRRLTD